MKTPTKKEQKARRDRVSRIYTQTCSGIQISIWDMSKIMDVGLASIEAGDDDTALGQKIRAFVETIRKN